MCFVIADCAHSGTAAFAFADLAAVLEHDVVGFDPFAAAFANAVNLVLGLVFEELAVPCSFELLGEEFVDMFEVDVFVRAAARRHVGGVSDGHLEDAPKTRVAHTVFAGEAGGLGDGDVIRAAC